MSNAIVEAIEDAAKKVAQAAEDGGKAVGKFFTDTSDRLRTSVHNLADHDDRSAESLERAGRLSDTAPTAHGVGGDVTHSAQTSAQSPAGKEIDSIKFAHDVRDGLSDKQNDPLTSRQFPPGYDPYHGETPEQYLARYSDGKQNKYGQPNWNWDEETKDKGNVNGAVHGDEEPTQVATGTVLDRYGANHGRFLSPDGTSYPERGLPAQNLADGYHRYRVLKPLPSRQGVIAPAFGEPGQGLQFRLDESVKWYENNHYLKEIT